MSDRPHGEGWWLASDGKYYPPQPQSPQPVVANNDSGGLKAALMVLAVFVVFSVLGFGCVSLMGREAGKQLEGAGDRLEEAIQSATGVADEADYEIMGPMCATGDAGAWVSFGTITNTSKERQAFQITIRFVAPDGSLVESVPTFTDGLDPGEAQDWKLSSASSEPPEGTTCEVEEVRYSIFD